MIESIKTRKTERRTEEEFSLYDSDIPDSLLTEILLRLPLKSIFLFKTVSKRWLSLISDPFFARSYVTRINNESSLSRLHQQWILLIPIFVTEGLPNDPVIPYPTSFNPAGFSKLSSSLFSLSFLPKKSVFCPRVLASSNGLVLCCGNVYPLTYYVCNPLTKQYVILPKPASLSQETDAGFICQDDGSYKVVRIPNHESSSKTLELEIFSSETGTWRELNFSCPVQNYSRLNHIWVIYSPISYNGILHWAADKQIFAYDPSRITDQCYSMDLPKGTESIVNYILSICCGRLCCLAFGNCLTLWELTNYESGKWHLKHTMKSYDTFSTDAGLHESIESYGLNYLRPLGMHPFDPDTVYASYRRSRLEFLLVSCNFRTRRLEIVGYRPGWVPNTRHLFVLPPWPTLIPQPSWGPKDI